MTGFFITGTDTAVGKTAISLALIEKYKRQNKRVIGFKPVASGAHTTPQGLRNDDACRLQSASNVIVDYHDINPYCFSPAIAPHLAAHAVGEKIELETIVTAYRNLENKADVVIVEGAGGWCVPLNDEMDIAMLAQRLALPVVLVVAVRLGCLNHALLTARDITACGVSLAGWIANFVDAADEVALANVDSLKKRIAAPCWGVVPHLDDHAQVAAHLNPPSMSSAL